jgi:Flp pilus assembly protein TadB
VLTGESSPGSGFAAAGLAAFAVASCAGATLVVVVLSGIALGTLVAVGVAGAALVAMLAARVVLIRRRRPTEARRP